jgi:hypothetical protein
MHGFAAVDSSGRIQRSETSVSSKRRRYARRNGALFRQWQGSAEGVCNRECVLAPNVFADDDRLERGLTGTRITPHRIARTIGTTSGTRRVGTIGIRMVTIILVIGITNIVTRLSDATATIGTFTVDAIGLRRTIEAAIASIVITTALRTITSLPGLLRLLLPTISSSRTGRR